MEVHIDELGQSRLLDISRRPRSIDSVNKRVFEKFEQRCIMMSFNTYEEASKGLNEEFLEIMDNVLLPILTGQSVIHIRTHEENRVFGICDTIPTRISKTFRVLQSSVRQALNLHYFHMKTMKKLNSQDSQLLLNVEMNIKAFTFVPLIRFLEVADGGVLSSLASDHACHQH